MYKVTMTDGKKTVSAIDNNFIYCLLLATCAAMQYNLDFYTITVKYQGGKRGVIGKLY